MPGPSVADLTSAIGASVLSYGWAAGVVVVASARADGPSGSDALGNAIAQLSDVCDGIAADRRAIVVGSHSAAMAETRRFASEIRDVGASLVNPALFPPTVMNATSGQAAIRHCCEGPNVTLSNGATSALDALVHAADLVTDGRASLVLAGGFETRQAPADGPAAVAVVWAIMDEQQARRAGRSVLGWLIGTASGSAVQLEAADPTTNVMNFRSWLAAVAAGAARSVLEREAEWDQLGVVHVSTAEEALTAMAEGFELRLSALTACRGGELVGTAVVVASAVSNGTYLHSEGSKYSRPANQTDGRTDG